MKWLALLGGLIGALVGFRLLNNRWPWQRKAVN